MPCDNAQMKQAVLTELKEKALQPLPETVTKVIQLYETKNSRHSTMIVGATLSGKTVTWRVLRATLSRLCKDGETGFNLVKVFGRYNQLYKCIKFFTVFIGRFDRKTCCCLLRFATSIDIRIDYSQRLMFIFFYLDYFKEMGIFQYFIKIK